MRKNAVVAGTGFEGRTNEVRSHCKVGKKVILIREPNNNFDENAIAVYLEVPKLFGILGSSEIQIGYVKASTAKSLAKKMDKGVELSASVISYFAPSGKEFPRVSIEVTDEI
ncbi:MAG: HIRAN domain-containing protein [Xanthomonadales bacterium]|nr:HIRAN domain-containing protein [Xanthomonadales bacterium]